MIDQISPNAAAFSNALMGLAEFVDGSFEKVVRKTCFDLYTRIIKRTPVDTGRAKASWGIGTEHSDAVAPKGEYAVTDLEHYSPSDISSAMTSSSGGFTFTVDDDQVIIYNNVEYIADLENGSSQQALSGMVALSLAEFTAHFEIEAAKLEL